MTVVMVGCQYNYLPGVWVKRCKAYVCRKALQLQERVAVGVVVQVGQRFVPRDWNCRGRYLTGSHHACDSRSFTRMLSPAQPRAINTISHGNKEWRVTSAVM